MVQLLDEGDLIIGEPGNEDELPQRPGSLQGLRKQIPTQLEQLRLVARGGKLALPKVMTDVERFVVLPHRWSLVPEPDMSSLPEPRHELQAARDEPLEFGEAKGSPLV